MNWPTVIVLIAVAAAFVAAVASEIRRKRKPACGGNCGNCSCGCGR